MSIEEAPLEKITITVQGRQIVLDPLRMKYNENTLPEFMSKEYSWIDYFGKQLEYAQKEVLMAEMVVEKYKIELEAQYSLKFMEAKDNGNSDNYAKAFANANVDIVGIKNKILDSEQIVIDRKEIVGHLKSHVKAWNSNHENANNRSHSIRAEMKVLNRDIFTSPDDDNTCTAEDILSSFKNG